MTIMFIDRSFRKKRCYLSNATHKLGLDHHTVILRLIESCLLRCLNQIV